MGQPLSELDEKGYTKDKVRIYCEVCGKKADCKYTRNMQRGINYGRPLIQTPDDWKIVMTLGESKQKVLCENCHPEELERGKRGIPLL